MNFQTKKINVRGLQYYVQEWGDESNPKLFMLHGWMDCGASFKFMMPYLADRFHIIAPDLRGFGNTEHAAGGYWYPDYFADLEVLFNHYSPNHKVDLIGHSMGGNIAFMYAGIRPQRVKRVLSLDSVGLPRTTTEDTPKRYSQWMTEILSGEPSKIYPDRDMLRLSIETGNPSLSAEIIEELIDLWGKPVGDKGEMSLKHDHNHRYMNPVRYNFEDTLEVWRQITARVGLVIAGQCEYSLHFIKNGRVDEMKEALQIKDNAYFVVENSNHMLHLEQPQETAECVLAFFN